MTNLCVLHCLEKNSNIVHMSATRYLTAMKYGSKCGIVKRQVAYIEKQNKYYRHVTHFFWSCHKFLTHLLCLLHHIDKRECSIILKYTHYIYTTTIYSNSISSFSGVATGAELGTCDQAPSFGAQNEGFKHVFYMKASAFTGTIFISWKYENKVDV